MELGKVYNFGTISTTLLQGTYRGFTLTGISKYKQLLRYSVEFGDLVTIRQQLITELGIELLSITEVTFFIFTDELGNEIALAEDWIVTDSIEEVLGTNMQYEFTGLSSTDLAVINNAINALGYSFTSKVV